MVEVLYPAGLLCGGGGGCVGGSEVFVLSHQLCAEGLSLAHKQIDWSVGRGRVIGGGGGMYGI